MKFQLILLFAIIATFYMVSADLDSEWEDFKKNFTKSYSKEEEIMRKKLFAENLIKVEKHNKEFEEGKVSYTLGVNQFSDLTTEEKSNAFGHGIVRNPEEKENQQHN